jgi:cytolysin-activating lysine-acyltransferase
MARGPQDAGTTDKGVAQAGAPTLSHMLGEMVWLLSQSPIHRHLSLADLEWLIMPPLLLEQFRVFRGEATPVGLALWAYLTPAA